jgi:hypothetical protein
MVSGSYLLTPPKTFFTNYPLYTDELAAIVDWFKANWKETRKPGIAYLTADSAAGRSIDIPEMQAYLVRVLFAFRCLTSPQVLFPSQIASLEVNHAKMVNLQSEVVCRRSYEIL